MDVTYLFCCRNGDIVSGDSSGSTQFWDGQLGTLLQAHTRHKADVLALAASPSHRSVFAAGADGQVCIILLCAYWQLSGFVYESWYEIQWRYRHIDF